jgi:hypothetical protein
MTALSSSLQKNNWATKNQEKIDLINKVESKVDISEFKTHERDNFLDIKELKEVKADKGVMESELKAINSSLLRIERKLDRK